VPIDKWKGVYGLLWDVDDHSIGDFIISGQTASKIHKIYNFHHRIYNFYEKIIIPLGFDL